MTQDWLDNVLDEGSPEPVPPGFRDRVLIRVAQDDRFGGRLLSFWLPRAAVAAAFVVVGFWLGSGRPDLTSSAPLTTSAALASAELMEIYESQQLLESAWEFVLDEDLELALTDAAAGTWDPVAPEK